MDQFTNEEKLHLILRRGPAAAGELSRSLGFSQPSLSRLIDSLRRLLLVFVRARSTRYSLKRDVRGLGGEFPLCRISVG